MYCWSTRINQQRWVIMYVCMYVCMLCQQCTSSTSKQPSYVPYTVERTEYTQTYIKYDRRMDLYNKQVESDCWQKTTQSSLYVYWILYQSESNYIINETTQFWTHLFVNVNNTYIIIHMPNMLILFCTTYTITSDQPILQWTNDDSLL